VSGLYSTRRWRNLRAQFRQDCRAAGERCGICRQPIDYTLQHPDPLSWQADHRLPARDRPDLFYVYTNLQSAHKKCNESRKASELTTWVQPTW
jgi:5-methylcytosine-specific restriction endonuclease McrA